MLKTNEKLNLKALKALKTSLPCYGVVSETRFFESELIQFKTSCVFDFGSKHNYKTVDLDQSNFSIHKIKDFETRYNEILIDFASFKRFKAIDQLFLVFSQKVESKYFIKGRLLNVSQRGFFIGACGVVGLLPLNSGVKINHDKTIVVYVESINFNRKIINFAQKGAFKKAQRVLFKLSSKLLFSFELNSKYVKN